MKREKIVSLISLIVYGALFVVGKIIQIFTEYSKIGGYLMLFSIVMLMFVFFYFMIITFSRKCPNCGEKIQIQQKRKYRICYCPKCGHMFSYLKTGDGKTGNGGLS